MKIVCKFSAHYIFHMNLLMCNGDYTGTCAAFDFDHPFATPLFATTTKPFTHQLHRRSTNGQRDSLMDLMKILGISSFRISIQGNTLKTKWGHWFNSFLMYSYMRMRMVICLYSVGPGMCAIISLLSLFLPRKESNTMLAGKECEEVY